jgi:hypothetical protein
MFKRHGKTILIIVIVIQLTLPFWFLAYQANINKHLNESVSLVKLNLNSVDFYNDTYDENEICITVDFYELFQTDELHESDYVTFEASINGEYSVATPSKTPKNDCYININSLYELEYYEFAYQNEFLKDTEYLALYNKENELKNVASGISNGSLTEAYVILKVYKDHFQVEEIYIDGYTLDEFVELYSKGEKDVARYEYFYYDSFEDYPELAIEEYLKLIDEDDLDLYRSILDNLDMYIQLSKY